MTEVASAYVSLLPSARGFGRATTSQIGPQMRTSGVAAGAGLGRAMLKGFIAIGVGVKIAQFLGDSVAEAREAQKVAALTNNVIKTTGGVAKVSAVQVNRLADALSRKTGIDDEQIASSANMLLTFKNIVREGEGVRNIFNRATRAAVDLSASGFGDIIGTSKQLGKALNDPVKGLTALGRSGVTFTAQQIEQVKALVASGKQFKAQQLILREVESQVKGAAEAQATNADRARVALGNLKEQIGTALLPALDAMSGAFANRVAPAISGFITNLQSGNGSAGRFGDFIRNNVAPALRDLAGFIDSKVIPAFRQGLQAALEGGRAAFEKIRKAVADNKPELQQLWAAAKRIAEVFYTRVVPAVYAVAGQALKRLGTAISVAINVAGFLVRAYNTVRGAFDSVRSAVTATAGKFSDFARVVRQRVSDVVSTVQALPGKIRAAFGNAGSLLVEAGRNIIRGLISGIKAMAGAAADAALSVVKGAVDKAKGFLHIKSPSRLWAEIGKQSVDGLVVGMLARGDAAAAAAGKVADKATKAIRKKLTDALKQTRADFASLVEPIASNFTQGLFDAENTGGLLSNLTTAKSNLTGLLAAFKTLIGEGLKPAFLYSLFQEGGAGLILDLAKADKATALGVGALYSDVTSLADLLGTQVAGETSKGAGLENQTARLEKKLDKLIDHVDRVGTHVGREVNGAAANGRRRARR